MNAPKCMQTAAQNVAILQQYVQKNYTEINEFL